MSVRKGVLSINTICCCCLSIDRKLTPIDQVKDGVNTLYFLLSHDAEALEEIKRRGTNKTNICWECRALLSRTHAFKDQVCTAQKFLADVFHGRNKKINKNNCMSKLSMIVKQTYDEHFISTKDKLLRKLKLVPVNIINATIPLLTPVTIPQITNSPIKTAAIPQITTPTNVVQHVIITNDLTNNAPLKVCKLDPYNLSVDSDNVKSKRNMNMKVIKNKTEIIREWRIDGESEFIKLLSNMNVLTIEDIRKYIREYCKPLSPVKLEKSITPKEKPYVTVEMTEEAMIESIQRRKKVISYFNAAVKCESCVEDFEDQNALDKHNIKMHKPRMRANQCQMCLIYMKQSLLTLHIDEHYKMYFCRSCDYETYRVTDMLLHLRKLHQLGSFAVPILHLPTYIARARKRNKDEKYKRPTIKKEHRPSYGYLCVECNEYFELHHTPDPISECPKCLSPLRFDLMDAKSLIYNHIKYACITCDKTFPYFNRYLAHYKKSSTHCKINRTRLKCDHCSKLFVHKTDLIIHINFDHLGIFFQCELCDKKFRSKRYLLRHIDAYHEKIVKDSPKICFICGKAFQKKQRLIEHERTHTGERPLVCALCGQSFRQRASLYTHDRLVHKKIARKPQVRRRRNDDYCTEDYYP